MKQTYSVLRSSADENTSLKIVTDGIATRGAALRLAKKMRDAQVETHGSWADRFYVAILEEV